MRLARERSDTLRVVVRAPAREILTRLACGGLAVLATGACSAPPRHAPPPTRSAAPSLPVAAAASAPDDRSKLCPPGVAVGTHHPPNEGTPISITWCVDARGQPEGRYERTVGRSREPTVVAGQFHAGLPIGVWTETEPGGRVTARESYDEAGKLDGIHERWTAAGVLVLRESYAHGARVGRYERWYPSGRPMIAGSFAVGPWPLDDLRLIDVPTVRPLPGGVPADDPRVGTTTPGDAASAWSARAGNSFPIGAWQRWGEDGAVWSIRTFDAAGIPDGRFCDGPACTTIVAGTGTLTYTDQVGKVRFSMRAGVLHGVRQEWDAKGQLLLRHTYRDGVLHGLWRENAIIDSNSTVGTYCDGHKCGRWTITGESSERTVEVYDRAGVQLSEQKWDSEGRRAGGWTKEEMDYYERGEIPPAALRRLRARCLRLMKTGDCCDHFEGMPAKAIVCVNGDKGR